jgi:hypothetical protein
MTSAAWTTGPLPHTAITVGPCAWHVTMLLEHWDYVRSRPSLVVVPADMEGDALRAAADPLHELRWPVLVGMTEPRFTRRLASMALARLAALGLHGAEVLALQVDDPAELKAGGALQALFELRNEGIINHLGLIHADPRMAQWLAINTPARAILTGYGLHDMHARHRALPAAAEHGMDCLSASLFGGHASLDALRFAWAERSRCLPVLRQPIPDDLVPMTEDEVESHWQAWQASHPAPTPLPRSTPPE